MKKIEDLKAGSTFLYNNQAYMIVEVNAIQSRCNPTPGNAMSMTVCLDNGQIIDFARILEVAEIDLACEATLVNRSD